MQQVVFHFGPVLQILANWYRLARPLHSFDLGLSGILATRGRSDV